MAKGGRRLGTPVTSTRWMGLKTPLCILVYIIYENQTSFHTASALLEGTCTFCFSIHWMESLWNCLNSPSPLSNINEEFAIASHPSCDMTSPAPRSSQSLQYWEAVFFCIPDHQWQTGPPPFLGPTPVQPEVSVRILSAAAPTFETLTPKRHAAAMSRVERTMRKDHV